MGIWIPNITVKELPGTRQFHLENSNQSTASVEVVLPRTVGAAAEYWALLNGGAVHPYHERLHIASIDVSHDYPKEFEGNTQEYYQDDCIKFTLNYKEWQTPNQGYESTFETITQVYSIPLRGSSVFLGRQDLPNLPNFHQPVWENIPLYLRRGNYRITRNYTGRRCAPFFLADYHCTINAQPFLLLEWGVLVPAEAAMFTIGNVTRQHTRDFSNSDPLAWIDLYSFSYSIEVIQGTWNSLHHPGTGRLSRLFDRWGNPISFYPKEIWNLTALIE